MSHLKPRIRFLNVAAENVGTSYANAKTAMKAVKRYGTYGASVALIPRKDGRIAVFLINPDEPMTDAVHGTPFVIWS